PLVVQLPFERGQEERSCLSGAGLSNADQVTARTGWRDCELLDGCGLLPAEVRDRAEQRRAGYEFVETHSLLRPSTCRGGPSAVATNERAVQAPGAAPGARAPGQAVRSASRPPRMSTDNLTERSGG